MVITKRYYILVYAITHSPMDSSRWVVFSRSTVKTLSVLNQVYQSTKVILDAVVLLSISSGRHLRGVGAVSKSLADIDDPAVEMALFKTHIKLQKPMKKISKKPNKQCNQKAWNM